MTIEIKNATKRYKNFTALDNVSLTIKSGELVALLGPSGSGKTTLLRLIAGLEFADFGEILFDGERINEQKVKDRGVGFVFQHYALFKNMSVFENVAFGLKVKPKKERLPESEIIERVTKLLKLVHLDAFSDRFPSQLSGGQRQRVALARALAVEPKMLLLDEPFGALDAKVRKELRRWMRRLHDEIHVTSVFVTHDQEEAMEVADTVVVMSHGRIEQVGTPEEVYNNPVNSFVYDFLGNYNQFEGWQDIAGNIELAEYDYISTGKKTSSNDDSTWSSMINIMPEFVKKLMPHPEKLDNITFENAANDATPPAKNAAKSDDHFGKKQVQIYCRPHELFVTKTPDNKSYITAQIVHINPAGPLVKLELERKNGGLLQAEITRNHFDALNIKKGEEIFVRPEKMRVFG
jgi:sulfate/thiosulfate transport system ATP-binding protein